VLAHYQGLIDGWQRALDKDPALLYLKDGWRAHSSDLDDDLRGQTCTPRTLQRADWLLQMLAERHALLQECGALAADDAALTREALLQRYLERQQAARGFQIATA
jgi:hypothetical protein